MRPRVQFFQKFGKLKHRVVSAVQTSLFSGSPRLFVLDHNSKITFLVDSGSDVSVLPKNFIPNPHIKTSYKLNAVNNSPITTFGIHELNLDFKLGTSYVWNFVVADVSTPIIGADFLNYFHILPDLKLQKLINNTNMCSVKCVTKESTQKSVYLVNADSDAQFVLKFASVFKPP